MITGDKNTMIYHSAANRRLQLQASQVEKLEVVYWGRGSIWPALPKEKFDVVTVQDPFWRGLFAWRAARRMGARFNVQVHTEVLNTLGRFILRRADSVRVVSEKIKKQVEAAGVRAKISVLPIYVDIERFKNIVPVPHAQKTILWIGRFEDEKDPLLALEVIKKIPGVKLVMLGAGSLENELRRQAKGLPVEFAGWQDPAVYLGHADVVLCTSRHESWGASIVEALAAGVPVVAPEVGIAKEAGAIVVPRSDLGKAVNDVLTNGMRGQLRLQLLNKDEWAARWKESL